MKDPLDQLVLPDRVKRRIRAERMLEEAMRFAPREDEAPEVWEDRRMTYVEDGQEMVLTPGDILVRAARMQRDGASLANVRAELGIIRAVPDALIESALRKGHARLDALIAAGHEPEESRRRVEAPRPEWDLDA